MIDAQRAFSRILEQIRLGPRFAGSPGHREAQRLLAGWLAGADCLREHRFDESFFGRRVSCCNFWGRFRGERPGRILFGTHYDTRPWADRDPDPARRHDPVPGANDGASGVALLAELATELVTRRARPTIDIVFFDAEDWHEIDGKEVSLGARRFVADLAPEERPNAVVIFDMVGGRDLVLDVDVSCQQHDASCDLTLALFRLGRALRLPAFDLGRTKPHKWIGCDHSPFMAAGIPSAILIDIEYPPWHTVSDLPDGCDARSLGQMGTLIDAMLTRADEVANDPFFRGPEPVV